MPSEADTCRRHVVPLLQSAGWDNEPHSIAEQRTITDGRIVPVGKGFVRRPPKRVDYLLRDTRGERAQQLRESKKDFFAQYDPKARQILDELLEKHAEHGDAQFCYPMCSKYRRFLRTAKSVTSSKPSAGVRICGQL
jgi:hypothetical protein